MSYKANKLVAFLLVLVMAFDAVPFTVVAEEPTEITAPATQVVSTPSEVKQLFMTVPKATDDKDVMVLEGEGVKVKIDNGVLPEGVTVSVAEGSVDQDMLDKLIAGEAKPEATDEGTKPEEAAFTKGGNRNASLMKSGSPADSSADTQTQSGAAVFEIGLKKDGEDYTDYEAESGLFSVHVDARVNMLSGVPENARNISYSYRLYHVVKGEPVLIDTTADNFTEKDGVLTGFDFTTDSFSPFVVVYTVDFTVTVNNVTKTALMIIGDAVEHSNYRRSDLYNPNFTTEFREAKQ